MNILEFMDDTKLTGDAFIGDSWQPWRSVLAAAFGLPMTPAQAKTFRKLSGGRKPPAERVRELWVVAGRRSAKTHVSGGVAVYLATVGVQVYGLLDKLSAGERGVISIIAVDRHQARVALGFIVGLLESSPVLEQLVERRNAESIDFTNRVSIEVHTNSFRSVRGRTLLAVILDECAFYRSDESASPDVETYRAVVPGLATTGGLLMGISSPYARRGLLYNKFSKHHGKNHDILVVRGGTRDFNSTIDQRVIEEAEADDPAGARSEWHGQFREDIERFVSREVIEKAMRPDQLEIPYNRWQHGYFAFVDPAGGGADEFTIAIGHQEKEVTVIDALRGVKGQAPQQTVAEFAQLLRDYCISQVIGDRYAGSWPETEFKRHGIRYIPAEKSKSQLYVDAMAALNGGQVELPPDDKLLAQFTNLERRTSRGGRDSIDHPPGGHDDRANAIAGLISKRHSRPRKRAGAL